MNISTSGLLHRTESREGKPIASITCTRNLMLKRTDVTAGQTKIHINHFSHVNYDKNMYAQITA